jgi:3-oxoacyl-[acyl-carrier-protein] synthase II
MDKDRRFVLGEGAGALILKNMNMLSLVEQLFTAKLVVVVCLLTILQHHIQMGAKNVMLNCLRDAGLKPTDVDGVNMHGTSTH